LIQYSISLTVALQGYGNVGYFFCSCFARAVSAAYLIAVANSKQMWLQPDGIDASSVSDPASLDSAQVLSSQAIIGVKADILVLAAQAMLSRATEKHIRYKQAAFELALLRLLG